MVLTQFVFYLSLMALIGMGIVEIAEEKGQDLKADLHTEQCLERMTIDYMWY